MVGLTRVYFCPRPKYTYNFAEAKRALRALRLRSQKTGSHSHKNLMRAKTELVFMSQVVAPLLSKIIARFLLNAENSGWRLGLLQLGYLAFYIHNFPLHLVGVLVSVPCSIVHLLYLLRFFLVRYVVFVAIFTNLHS